MRVAILSDLHLGFGWGTEREEDSFIQAQEALEKAISQADVVLIAGDIFDSRNPRQEVLKAALNLFSKLKRADEQKTKLIAIQDECGKKSENNTGISLHATHKLGVPLVAIYGTHERRGKTFVNPVKLLEEAGYLIQLDGQTALFERGKDKAAICGISGVPEIYARERIAELKPKPFSGATNILMLHQSIQGFVYMDDESPTLTVQDLPKGFDLIVNGHIHKSEKVQIGVTDLLFAGSTITTQVKKSESEVPKKIFFYDTTTKKIIEEELKSPRLVFYFELDGSGKPAVQIKSEIDEKISALAEKKFDRKPLVRVRIVGTTRDAKAVNFSEIADDFKNKLIIEIKNDLQSTAEKQKIATTRDLLEEKVSIDELGLRILNEETQKANLSFSSAEIFELLASGEIEKVEAELMENLDKKARPVLKVPDLTPQPKPNFEKRIERKGQQKLA